MKKEQTLELEHAIHHMKLNQMRLELQETMIYHFLIIIELVVGVGSCNRYTYILTK